MPEPGLQQTIEAGAGPAAVVEPLNRAEEECKAARADLEGLPATRALNHDDVVAILEQLGAIAMALDRADCAGLEELYPALRLEMLYDAEERVVDVTIRSTRGSARVRGRTCTLTTHLPLSGVER